MTAIFLVAVGCCVLAWGTLYKCSLYKNQAIQRQTPEAKLCTRASESAKQGVDSTVSGDSSAVVVQFLDPQLTLAEPLSIHLVRQEEPPPAVIPLRKTPSLFLRPPPSLISFSA